MADQESTPAHTLDLTLESSLESVDTAEDVVVREAKEAGFEEDDLHKIGIAVRECMVNAVVHGNRYNARKKVQLKAARAPGRIAISIADEGDGFDLSAVPDPRANENLLRFSGRGVMLMQAFMDEFQVSTREPRGTEVKMTKHKTETR